jgi:hypothetical protein
MFPLLWIDLGDFSIWVRLPGFGCRKIWTFTFVFCSAIARIFLASIFGRWRILPQQTERVTEPASSLRSRSFAIRSSRVGQVPGFFFLAHGRTRRRLLVPCRTCVAIFVRFSCCREFVPRSVSTPGRLLAVGSSACARGFVFPAQREAPGQVRLCFFGPSKDFPAGIFGSPLQVFGPAFLVPEQGRRPGVCTRLPVRSLGPVSVPPLHRSLLWPAQILAWVPSVRFSLALSGSLTLVR